MKVTVDQLFSLSRLPFHFWTELNGGRQHYDNPGSSILSFAVTKASNEIVDVPPELHESMQECTDFTKRPDSIMHVFTWLGATTTEAVQKASNLPDHVKPKVFGEMNTLMTEYSSCKHLYETIAGSDGELPELFDNTSQLGKMFIQAMINTKHAVNQLMHVLTTLDPPKELA